MALRDRRLPELALFAAAAVLHTWPLASAPATWARVDNADTALNAWAIAWVGMALLRDPLHLFDANIFYPEPRTLAFSEVMLPQALIGAPLTWAAVDPVLVYNLLALIGLALSGFAMAWLVARWTGDRAAGVVAGLAYAFNAFILVRFAHLQAMHTQFLPVALFALDQVIAAPRTRMALVLALAVLLQALTSNYLLVMTAVAMLAAAAVRHDAWRPRQLTALAGAALAASLALAPFLYPYWLVHTEQGFIRPYDTVAQYSGTWREFLSTGGSLHYGSWSRPFFERSTSSLFPGFTIAALAIAAVASGVAWRDRRARMALAIGIAGAALSLGVNLPGYRLLYDYVPLFQGIRAASRLGWLALLALPILAGFTLARWRQRLPKAAGAALAVVAAMAVTAEALRAPLGFEVWEGIPRIYDRVAAADEMVLVELPFPPQERIFENGASVLYSAWHLKPILNGYSGFMPASYAGHVEVMDRFPSADSVRALGDIGVTHVLIHKRRVSADLRDRCARAPELTLVADEADQILYSIRPGGR